MVEMAKRAIPEGMLYEAVVETRKCLPDAIQLLTPCSMGNSWMNVLNLGRYALSLFDKRTGEGARVHLDRRSWKYTGNPGLVSERKNKKRNKMSRG